MSWFYLLLFLVWIFGFTYSMSGLRKAPGRLQSWADRHGLAIIDRKEPVLAWKGPFGKRTSAQRLYRVIVEDEKGHRRSAWVLCGKPLLGSWADQVEVRWDQDRDEDASSFQSACIVLSPDDNRLLTETMRASIFGCSLLGCCLGVGIAVDALIVTGLIWSNAAALMLVIGIVLGVIVGGLFGIVHGALAYRTKDRIKHKAVIDEI
jgi:hypothetical protein